MTLTCLAELRSSEGACVIRLRLFNLVAVGLAASRLHHETSDNFPPVARGLGAIDDAKGRAWIVERGLDQHRVRGAALVSSGS
jgi:hypothetical protein